MQNIIQQIQNTDWKKISEEMHQNGYAVLDNLLTDDQCEALKADYNRPDLYRKTVVMARKQYGLGEYKYFKYPLPDIIQGIRSRMYPHLAPIANTWFSQLNIDKQFPLEHRELLQECHEKGQEKATVLILKYGQGGYNRLHQDIYGAVYFPIQVVLFLNEPDQDYTGGEFVLTQDVPKTQSKAIVLKPKKGSALIFTTNFKPENGAQTYYKVHMRHGISEVRSGERHTLGIIFHDALS